MCFYLSILGFLCMLKIISTILRKIFWIFKRETMLVCLPAKPLCVLVLLLALTSLFVLSWIFVLIFRKGQPNLLFCKFLAWFHNCYCHSCWILNFNIHSPPCFKNNSMRIFKRSSFIIIFIVSFSGSVDMIVFYKTGNHLPQRSWFSRLFFSGWLH